MLTDPDAIARWAPLPFDVDALDTPRLVTGSTARVSGRLAGRRVGFVVEVHEAEQRRLSLAADGPSASTSLRPRRHDGGSEVHASVSVRSGKGSPAASSREATTPCCPPARSPTPSRASRREAACPAPA